MTLESLTACLLTLPSAQMLGLTLLQESQPAAGWYPTNVPLDTLTQATLELIDYGDSCTAAATRLLPLRPVPLAVPVMEYPL